MTEHLSDLPAIGASPVMGQAITHSAVTKFQFLSGAF
jgi:hypothetical protein